jgi:tetratricopeptide (TPR) repeat protein
MAQGAPGLSFAVRPIGPAPHFRPTITNVQIGDLNADGRQDVIACDVQANAVYCYYGAADGSWTEKLLADGLLAPAHATVVDLDRDGDYDVLASVMGSLYPDDDVVGSLVWLEQRDGEFAKRTLLRDVRRVVDAQPGDFDADGDLDLAVAVFGYLRGEVLWLENMGQGRFRDRRLLSAPGAIHVPVADYDGDGDLDIAAVISQEEEEVWGFENLGGGRFTPRRLWMTLNYDLGSAGLVKSDLDHDGDVDLLLPAGDNLEDSYAIPQPYHGCLWLENKGLWKFAAHRIANFPGTYAAAAADLDADGDEDVALASMVNDWSTPTAASLVWLENDGRQQFSLHAIAADPIKLVTLACGDLDGDGRPDIVAGGLHMYPPYERMGRITSWLSNAAPMDRGEPAATRVGGSAASAAGALPPDLSRLDPLTRGEIEDVYHIVAEPATGASTASQWQSLGQAYYAYGYFAAAKNCFAKAVQLEPKSFFPNFLLGVSQQRLGELQVALGQFKLTAPLADPARRAWVWYEIGRCQLRLEAADDAEAAFIGAGEYPLALAQLARLKIRDGRAREAVATLNALAAQQGGATELFLLNAQAAGELHDEARQAQFADRAEYNSRRMIADPIAAMMDEYRKKYGAARLVEEARRMIRDKRWSEATSVLANVVEVQPDFDAIILLAGAELEAGRPQRTIELLEQLMADRGRWPVAMLLLGDAYLAAGRNGDAVALWQSLAEVRSDATLHERLATQAERSGDEAEVRRQRALKQQAAGLALLRQANPSLAKVQLEAAAELDPALVDAWFYLGECRRFTGDAAGARQAYAKALELDPTHGRAAAHAAAE